MRKAIVVACVMMFLSISAFSQETPKAELFGGYSYFHADGGGNFNGWNGSIAVNLKHWVGLVGDFRGHYSSDVSEVRISIPGFPSTSSRVEADANIYNFLFGPRFSYRKKESITPFAHALFGASRAHFEGTATTVSGSTSVTVSFSGSETSFAAAFGGGLDLKLGKSFALRVIQADYLLTGFGNSTQHNARISTGLVFRLGSK